MERKRHWEQIYTHKPVDEVSWFQPHPDYSLRLITAANISKTEPMIDVGGGASRLVDALLEDGYGDVGVLDISATALRLASARLAERAEQVQWFEADVMEFKPPRSYALWHDRAVFHFLVEPAERWAYRQCLERGLRAGGQLVIATFALDGPEQCSNLPVQRYSEESLSAELGDGYRLLDSLTEVHITPAQKEQHFVYCRFQKR
ncbi:MAG: class I SAM-dependent methyltransferase [Thiohalomonadaceae bacterium]